MPTRLIVTTPHGKCPRSPTRQCDLAADVAGNTFVQSTSRHQGLECHYVKGNEFRVDHDLNRRPSRTTGFRRRVTRLLETFMGSPTLSIDIHSFPNYWEPEAGDINFFKRGERPPELVILEGPLDNYEGISLSRTLLGNLTRQGVHCKIITGIKVNDILSQSSEFRVPGVLLEFNEKFLVDKTRLKTICQIIVHILDDIARSVNSPSSWR